MDNVTPKTFLVKNVRATALSTRRFSQKTKVLFVITKSNFGGAQKYVFDIATGLPKDKFDVAVALGGSGTLIQKLHAEHIRVLPIFSLARDVNLWSDITTFF